ncbi:unnamed protein product [Oikopleura dioica]|uniref:Uncharacterized protein n=1 Tax=Oikopleura dioica TaxID=34765 RepID=E4XM44_OIKDI|nr:unnamed protein product [Oikopleura dioica]
MTGRGLCLAVGREIVAIAYCKEKSSKGFKNKETRECSIKILERSKNKTDFGRSSSNTGFTAYGEYLSAHQCHHYPGATKPEMLGLVHYMWGSYAEKTAHPHISRILYVWLGRDSNFCDGSIIHKRFILTAAHCFVGWNENPSSYQVLLGDNSVYSLESIECHEQYKITGRQVLNDICILKTKKDIEFNRDVWPICLPDNLPPPNSEELAGMSCLVNGWSENRFYEKINVLTLTPEKCQERYNKYNILVDADQHVCAVHERKDQNACYGKSGGPLICDRRHHFYSSNHMALKRNMKVLTGIQSFDDGCAKPGVFTNINHFLPWIFKKIFEHDNCFPENPCKNGGICIDDFHGHKCECQTGWINEDCSLREIVMNQCLEINCHFGRCEVDFNYQAHCICPPNWQGTFCALDVNECLDDPCAPGAGCVNNDGGYECFCLFGYEGDGTKEGTGCKTKIL